MSSPTSAPRLDADTMAALGAAAVNVAEDSLFAFAEACSADALAVSLDARPDGETWLRAAVRFRGPFQGVAEVSLPRDLEGNGALVRPRDDTVGRRTKLMMGRSEWSDYTVEADVRGLVMRRQRGDVGLINQRYVLMLFGNNQKLELQPWQTANEMTVSVPNVAAFDCSAA